MLLNVDLQSIPKYLNPHKEKLKSKGIDSVISRVVNLSEIRPDISHELFCSALEK
jgi:lipoate-protein ligase A